MKTIVGLNLFGDDAIAYETINELSDCLEAKGFQSFHLKIALDNFINHICETIGSTNTDELRYNVFEWFDDNEELISVDIAIISEPIDTDDADYEEFYLVK